MTHQPGTQVRIIAPRAPWFGQVGTVTDTAAGQYHVSGLDFPGPLWFYPHELEAAPRAQVTL